MGEYPTHPSRVEEKLRGYGLEVIGKRLVRDDVGLIRDAVLGLFDAGADLMVTTGGLSVDPDDLTREGVEATGARVISYGAPLFPGAMFLVAKLKGKYILGAPACIYFDTHTALDVFLPRIMAGRSISARRRAKTGIRRYVPALRRHAIIPTVSSGRSADMERLIIAIRGAGEMASGVARRLSVSGFTRIIMSEIATPISVRRKVSFCEAVYEKEMVVEGVRAELIRDLIRVAVGVGRRLPGRARRRRRRFPPRSQARCAHRCHHGKEAEGTDEGGGDLRYRRRSRFPGTRMMWMRSWRATEAMTSEGSSTKGKPSPIRGYPGS